MEMLAVNSHRVVAEISAASLQGGNLGGQGETDNQLPLAGAWSVQIFLAPEYPAGGLDN